MRQTNTATHVRVWDVVCRIPKGKVASYGTIAALCGRRGQARLVGYALHNLPHGSEVPWHRVVNARGMVSLKGEGGRKQRGLLEAEGVEFIRGRIDLHRFGLKTSRRPGKRLYKQVHTPR